MDVLGIIILSVILLQILTFVGFFVAASIVDRRDKKRREHRDSHSTSKDAGDMVDNFNKR